MESITREIAIAQVDFATLNRAHYRHRNAIGKFVRREYVALDSETEARIGLLAEKLCRLHRIESWMRAKEFVARDKAMCNGSVSKQFGC
ncbi:MAG: hypothetical protein V4563_14835 [Pseudomonadota bacterium]